MTCDEKIGFLLGLLLIFGVALALHVLLMTGGMLP